MEPTKQEIMETIRSILGNLPVSENDHQIGKIESILETNLERKRILGFISGDWKRLEEYIWLVVENYRRLSGYLHKIQVERDNETWTELLLELKKWAKGYLMKKNTGNPQLEDMIAECANEVSIKLMQAYFPYDTDFDPWAHRVTYHACLHYLRRAAKPSNPANHLSLDDENLSIPLIDQTKINQYLNAENRMILLDAIEQLSPARQEVILMTYFQGAPPEEIAKKLNRSVSAVYQLKFQATNELRKILSRFGNINE